MTAYRMVRTLESADFLVRDTTTNQYHLGPAAISMAYVAEDYSDFVEHARPYLEELLAMTGESVTLAVPVDGLPVCVSILNSARPFQRQAAPGRIIGDLAAVHTKIFTAFGSSDRRAAVLAQKRRAAHAAHGHRPGAAHAGAGARRRGRRRLRRGGPVRRHLLGGRSGARPARSRRGGALGGHAGRPLRPGRARSLRARRQGGRGLLLRLSRLERIPAVSRPVSPVSQGCSTKSKGQRLR